MRTAAVRRLFACANNFIIDTAPPAEKVTKVLKYHDFLLAQQKKTHYNKQNMEKSIWRRNA